MAYKNVSHSKYNNPNSVEQWVKRVVNFSSEYDTQSWPASCVEGPPKVYPKYGDIAGAWAQKDRDAHQFIEVEFEEKIFIEKIDIYETYHAGMVKSIKAKKPDGKWYTVWETSRVSDIKSSRIFSPEFEKLNFQCNVLKINVDCTVANNWTEIDAIKIVGTKFNFDLPPPPEDITNDLAQIVNNDLYSDITFDVNGVMFYGHRAILSVRSRYFADVLCSDNPNIENFSVTEKNKGLEAPPSYESVALNSMAPVKIKDVDDKAFEVVLYYIYTNKLSPSCPSTVLTKVWRTADRFNLEGLKSLAILQLSSTALTIDNVVEIYVDVISSVPIIDHIKAVCESFMQNNMAEIVRHPSFTSLPQETMVSLVQKMTEKLSIK